jgi:dihydroxyacetone kinase-like predicted kinase
VLPNNSNVVMTAEQAARLSERPVLVVPTRSLQAGLAAMVAFDGQREALENAEQMRNSLEGLGTGAVTTAVRDVELDGLLIRAGDYLGLVGEDPIVGGTSFEEVAMAVIERLLGEPRDVLTLLTGSDEQEFDPLVRAIEERHPGLELEVHAGGQPHYPLLISAE